MDGEEEEEADALPDAEGPEAEEEEAKSAISELSSASIDGSSEGRADEAAAPGSEEAPAEMARTA